MAGPSELPRDSSIYEQIGYGLTVGLAAAGWIIQQVFAGRKDAKKSEHAILETAEIADLSVLRAIAPKLDQVIRLQQKVEDLIEEQVEARKRDEKIIELLERIDREDEIERRLQHRLQDEHRRR